MPKSIKEVRAENSEDMNLAIAQSCPFTVMKRYADADFSIIKRAKESAESKLLEAVVEKIEGSFIDESDSYKGYNKALIDLKSYLEGK